MENHSSSSSSSSSPQQHRARQPDLPPHDPSPARPLARHPASPLIDSQQPPRHGLLVVVVVVVNCHGRRRRRPRPQVRVARHRPGQAGHASPPARSAATAPGRCHEEHGGRAVRHGWRHPPASPPGRRARQLRLRRQLVGRGGDEPGGDSRAAATGRVRREGVGSRQGTSVALQVRVQKGKVEKMLG